MAQLFVEDVASKVDGTANERLLQLRPHLVRTESTRSRHFLGSDGSTVLGRLLRKTTPDIRHPDVIFKSGFRQRGRHQLPELLVRQGRRNLGLDLAVRGASSSMVLRVNKKRPQGWVYEIADPGNGIDARTALPLHQIILRSGKEISFVGEIAPEFIKSARFTGKWGWQGPTIENPGFAGR